MTVWAINNQGAASHEGFAKKLGFEAPILVDEKFAVSTQYDAVMGFGPLRIVNRTVVGIAKDGTVTYYKRGMPSTDEILGALT